MSSACANTAAELTDEVQHMKPAACFSRRDCTCPPPLPLRDTAQWVTVVLAPIMNSLFHRNMEYFHRISFTGIMRAGGKLTAGQCNSMAPTALFSTVLRSGACLSVWSSCVGLDTSVQVKWLWALMESPHLPDVYINSAYCYWRPCISSRHIEECRGNSKNSTSMIAVCIYTVWRCWPQKPMHANWLAKKIQKQIMPCRLATEGSC